MSISITNIEGFKIGHAQNDEALTGCTVILCEAGAVGGVDQRGGAPGTRETNPLHPLHLVERVHAVVLSGGSAFGLDAAGGVVRFLEERGVGFDTVLAKVPIVPAAILYDLAIGRPDIRPDAAMGYLACQRASTDPPASGNVGAGCGATIGKLLGFGSAMKSGLGNAGIQLESGLVVAAIVAVNAFGDVIDPATGRPFAGTRLLGENGETQGLANSLEIMKRFSGENPLAFGQGQNTVIGVVATNANLNKEGVNKVAQMAHDGLARAIRPAHTMLDGDTIFALSKGDVRTDVNLVGALAAEAFTAAILDGVRQATPAGGLPAWVDL